MGRSVKLFLVGIVLAIIGGGYVYDEYTFRLSQDKRNELRKSLDEILSSASSPSESIYLILRKFKEPVTLYIVFKNRKAVFIEYARPDVRLPDFFNGAERVHVGIEVHRGLGVYPRTVGAGVHYEHGVPRRYVLPQYAE
jgi:hypothetical protein